VISVCAGNEGIHGICLETEIGCSGSEKGRELLSSPAQMERDILDPLPAINNYQSALCEAH
jgi:hypothetical protein